MATNSERKNSTATSNTCLICDGSTQGSARNAISLFKHCVTSSKRIVVKVIDEVLGITSSSEDVHSIVVCHQCFKSLNEVDELEHRIAYIKSRLTSQYRRTLKNKCKLLDVQTIKTIDDDQSEAGTSKSVKKQRHQSKIAEDSIWVPIEDTVEDETVKNNTKQKCSSLENLIEILEGDDIDIENDEGSSNESGDKCTQKFISFSDIEQEAMHPELEIDENHFDGIHDEVEPDYVVNDTNSPNKPKTINNPMKKNIPEIQIPRMLVHHDGKVYTCLLCSVDNKFTADAKGIVDHAKNVHQINLYICDICGKEFLKK